MPSNMYARLVSEAASPAQAVVSLAIVDEAGATVNVTGASDGTARGTVLRQPAFADLVAAPTMANFNALLAALRSAGVIAA